MAILREWIHRLWGSLTRKRRDDDLAEELRSFVALAEEAAQGEGHPRGDEVRAARIRSGGVSQAMDALRDQRGIPWLDRLISDVVFGWRQLRKRRAATTAAILSLALTMGATTAAFRLVDAVILRKLPVADPDRLFYITTIRTDSQNRPEPREDFDYPTFRRYAAAVADRADVMVVGINARWEALFQSSAERERIYRQYVSGNVFATLGLQPTLGRVLTPADDVTPGAHPVAVLSDDFWTRRFGRDPQAIGSTFRVGSRVYEIVGVAPAGFTGTEPGRLTDVFIPAMMNADAINHPGWSWFRMWLRPRAGVGPDEIERQLRTVFDIDRRESLSKLPSDTPKAQLDAYLQETLVLSPAGSGASGLQRDFRRPLWILSALVALVLLIACTNVANLLTAQALARGRELALRVSIGADRGRLVQLLLVEAALLAAAASLTGTLFAWWSAPFVVAMLAPPEDPVRLVLDPGWRGLAFGVALPVAVTFVFGLAPAIRASAVDPLNALKGGHDSRRHRGLMNSFIAAQMAFCVFVLFVAWLFVASFERLSNRPLGITADRLLVIETEIRGKEQPAAVWSQVADHLHQIPGVEATAVASWPLLSGNRWTSPVQVDGGASESRPPYVLGISPGFPETLGLRLLDGRDFRPQDLPPGTTDENRSRPFVGIVNEAFARAYLEGRNPVGTHVTFINNARMEIVGLVRDAVYWNVRDPFPPTVYIPLEDRGNGTVYVRATGDLLALAPTLRREVSRARPDLVVRNVGPQSALVRRQMIRERLLSTLSLFFASVALLLAGIGLYGVLNYSVLQQRHEIGVRLALGARAAHVVRQVATEKLVTLSLGATIGIAAGLAFGQLVQALLFQVKPTHPVTVITPLLTLAITAMIAALSPTLRAVRIDPNETLRAE